MHYRLFRLSDVPALIEILRQSNRAAGKSDAVNEDRIKYLAMNPALAATENFTVAVNDRDEVIGAVIFMFNPESGTAPADIMLHPDYRTTDAAETLLARCEARLVERSQAEVPAGQPVACGFGVEREKTWLKPVLETHGYHALGGQYIMHIALDKPVQAPDFPPDFVLRPFDVAQGRAVHAVFQECFAEHRGGVAKIPYEAWSQQFNAPDFDAALWHVLYQGDDIAAICLCELKNETTGVVEVLGVRPAFRRHGLGGRLLRHAFHDFQRRGFSDVILDVDAENTTNAVALYENAGMQIQNFTAHYEKPLRA